MPVLVNARTNENVCEIYSTTALDFHRNTDVSKHTTITRLPKRFLFFYMHALKLFSAWGENNFARPLKILREYSYRAHSDPGAIEINTDIKF